MDFDDLLADPFEDPFAKPRSGSPDPWASFSHQPQAQSAAQDYQDPYKSAYDEGQSTTPTTESYATGERGESSQGSNADPLEASAVNAEDEEETHTGPTASTSPRTPGFRESISVLDPADHTQTISEPEPASPPARTTTPPTVTAPDSAVLPARGPSPPVARSPERSNRNTPVVSPPPSTSKVASPVISPLERPVVATSSLDRPFAGLALGGESIGGWQSDHGSWVNDPSGSTSNVGSATEEDDDDDDEPILKSRLNGGANSSGIVSLVHTLPAQEADAISRLLLHVTTVVFNLYSRSLSMILKKLGTLSGHSQCTPFTPE